LRGAGADELEIERAERGFFVVMGAVVAFD
jgi:hypothetical protein